MTWEQFFKWLMGWESREVHTDPRDPGGQTAWGISRRYWPKWAGWEWVDGGCAEDPGFASLVSDFYRTQYSGFWQALPARVNAVAVDTAVNMGHDYAVQCIQTALNLLAGSAYVVVDGKMGPRTMDAVKHADASALAYAMCAVRLAEYGRRGRNGDPRRVFLDGWINRVRSLMEVI